MDAKRREQILADARLLGAIVGEHHRLRREELTLMEEALRARKTSLRREAEWIRAAAEARRALPETAEEPDLFASAKEAALRTAGLTGAEPAFTLAETAEMNGTALIHLEFTGDGMEFECYVEPDTGYVAGFSMWPRE